MPFTAEEIASINNSALEEFISKGTVFKQNVINKPAMKAFDDARGSFSGGNEYVSVGVAAGQGGGTLAGYTHDDQLTHYNPATTKRAKYAWKEHYIGLTWSYTEAKRDGVDVSDTAQTSTSNMDGREAHVLANIIQEKNEALAEDYAVSFNTLLWGDGTSDTKAFAGLRSLLLEAPTAGTTGNVSRVANTWWRNRALTNSNSARVTSSTSNGGALLQALQKEFRLLSKFAQGGAQWKVFAGSDIYDAIELELRANGRYSENGFNKDEAVDGGMAALKFKGIPIVWDPSLADISKDKFLYIVDMKQIKLMYMNGQRMKKHNPSRPYDRMVQFNGLSTTCVLVAKQLNTSSIVEIA